MPGADLERHHIEGAESPGDLGVLVGESAVGAIEEVVLGAIFT
jgi:hypothetical protein